MSFLKGSRPLITSMLQARTPERIEYLMDNSVRDGADAFGMQFERIGSEYQTPETYKRLFAHAKGRPVYVTHYRFASNEGKSDEVLADEMLEIARCGATLCDVMGDIFDKTDGELTMDEKAIQKQKVYIDRLHKEGAEVLMSSHVMKFTPAERVLEIATEHKKRGADISKIVTMAYTAQEQIENLRAIVLLKEKLGIPFLFLCGGECNILRRVGTDLGCRMALGVYEHDDIATPTQPLIKQLVAIRDNIR